MSGCARKPPYSKESQLLTRTFFFLLSSPPFSSFFPLLLPPSPFLFPLFLFFFFLSFPFFAQLTVLSIFRPFLKFPFQQLPSAKRNNTQLCWLATSYAFAKKRLPPRLFLQYTTIFHTDLTVLHTTLRASHTHTHTHTHTLNVLSKFDVRCNKEVQLTSSPYPPTTTLWLAPSRKQKRWLKFIRKKQLIAMLLHVPIPIDKYSQ